MQRLLVIALSICLFSAMLMACSLTQPSVDTAEPATPVAPTSMSSPTDLPSEPSPEPTQTAVPTPTVVVATPTAAEPTATVVQTDAPANTPTTTELPTTVSTPTPTVPVSKSPAQPLGQSGEWELVFSDEFDVDELDTSKWEPTWFGDGTISKPVNTAEDGCYSAAQVSVQDGTLRLQAVETIAVNCVKRDDSPAKYMSGLVNTRNSFVFTYGYMEARIFLPGSDGEIWNWPAWWSDGTGEWPLTGEIDVMVAVDEHMPCWYYHYVDDNNEAQRQDGCVEMDGTGWHTYGAHWEADKITYYYDGAAVEQVTTGVVDAGHFLILNYGLREDFGIHVPATMEVDYVRVWQQ